jgi:adenylate cyclase
MSTDVLALDALDRCFGGAIPAVLCTASPDGTPNVTYISKAHRVDDERIALSNQFMSKTARNLAANPRASLLLIDPLTHDEFRLALVYERTERRGHVFERLRADIDAIAALEGMQDVFRLRAADIFRVVDLARVPPNPLAPPLDHVLAARDEGPDLAALAALAATISRAGDLDVLVGSALETLARSFGYAHTHLLLLDEEGRRLYTIASHGFDAESIGAEVTVGEGFIGMAARRCEPVSVGNLGQMAKYSRSVRRQFEDSGGVRPGREVPMPGLPGAESRIVVPAMALGELVGVLVADSRDFVAFGPADEQVLSIAASMLASAIEHVRALERDEDAPPPAMPSATSPGPVVTARAGAVAVRFFAVEERAAVDGDYLIKGVAGRILWALLRQHVAEGRTDFTNKELRLDPSLEMPGFKDNLESRLILLKRRLDERDAPVRIERTGRGRFRIQVDAPLRLEAVDV